MKRLTALRRAKGLSQARLAALARLHPTTVSLVENGRLQPGASQLMKLAGALGLSAAEAAGLLEEVEEVRA